MKKIILVALLLGIVGCEDASVQKTACSSTISNMLEDYDESIKGQYAYSAAHNRQIDHGSSYSEAITAATGETGRSEGQWKQLSKDRQKALRRQLLTEKTCTPDKLSTLAESKASFSVNNGLFGKYYIVKFYEK